MKRPFLALLILAVLALSSSSCDSKEETPTSPEAAAVQNEALVPSSAPAPQLAQEEKTLPIEGNNGEKNPKGLMTSILYNKGIASETTTATLEMKNGGIIEFSFFPKEAPIHVSNFIHLSEKGFYDGLSFHRVVAGFVAQGGDPAGNGTGGPGWSIKAEFNNNKHLLGSVAMARSQSPDSGGSQFYICLGPQSFLDNNYTVFGQLVKGQDVVNAIKIGDKINKVTIRY